MKVHVLGCSGAIAQNAYTTSFLVDDDLLVDAGTGVNQLSVLQMQRIEHVLLTHAHLDHIAMLALMVDAVGVQRRQPLRVYALQETIDALKRYIFNNIIWPDFTRIPSAESPTMVFVPIEVGQIIKIAQKIVEVLPAVHSVPAVAYAIAKQRSPHRVTPYWVFSGDTQTNPDFWWRVNQLNVGILVIEVAFSDKEKNIAKLSKHHSPSSLIEELRYMRDDAHYPIYITHTKPLEADDIMTDLLWSNLLPMYTDQSRISLLQSGKIFNL